MYLQLQLLYPVYALDKMKHMDKEKLFRQAFLNVRVAARLKILIRRKRAERIYETMSSWQRGGKATLAFKKFYRAVTLIQQNWKAVYQRNLRIQKTVEKTWVKLESAYWRKTLAEVDALEREQNAGKRKNSGADKEKGKNKLTMKERIELAMLPPPVRVDFIKKELR